jgi:hypothetical protein
MLSSILFNLTLAYKRLKIYSVISSSWLAPLALEARGASSFRGRSRSIFPGSGLSVALVVDRPGPDLILIILIERGLISRSAESVLNY